MTAAVSNNGSNTTGSSSSSAITMSSTDDSPSELFTTLLVAQIKNQNPLEPTDPSEFVGQLTQLSQMEALQNLVSQSGVTASMLESLQVLTLGGQVGSQVTVTTDTVNLSSEPVSGSFTLGNASAATTLVLTGEGGSTYKLQLGTHAPGEVAFTIDPEALGLPAGSYTMSVVADSGETPAIGITGQVQKVRLSPTTGVMLTVANLGEISSTAITAFNGSSVN
ncbi:flagellar basal body rod modification protein [Azoarcus indigens]|uniref:Basal-body rod modification protein FlgD n=1 Tax=Azoarcus indigens TaxID=29545 RepID=A0A4R6EFL8_9RHOO|nr:flagellar hook capping FlgD N-terminal domain-containing protein [Azoarcus indigens]NMG63528.1 flagellar basal body rod modification protein [Azoarcus indigens]TDN57079.1 flagellar basal-body rod modification protein FlgD [Azoarcus indigens]